MEILRLINAIVFPHIVCIKTGLNKIKFLSWIELKISKKLKQTCIPTNLNVKNVKK